MQPPVYGPGDGGESKVGDGDRGRVRGGSPNGSEIIETPIPPGPAEDLSRSFHGVVEIDPARLGGSAGAISQENVQRLASIIGSNVRVTLEIKADVPDGIPEKVERDVSENCNTLSSVSTVSVSNIISGCKVTFTLRAFRRCSAANALAIRGRVALIIKRIPYKVVLALRKALENSLTESIGARESTC